MSGIDDNLKCNGNHDIGGLQNGTANGDATTSALDSSGNPLQAAVASRLAAIRTQFNSGGVAATDADDSTMVDRRSRVKRSPARVMYAGLESAKTKFVNEAARTVAPAPNKSDKPRRITPPPREAVCVVENTPCARDPNVVSCDAESEIGREEWRKQAPTKNILAKFKDIEAGKVEEKSSNPDVVMDELGQRPQTKSTLEKWKNMQNVRENGSSSDGKPIQLRLDEAVEGGIFENEPEIRSDVVRSGSPVEDNLRGLITNTKEIRSTYLQRTAESGRVARVDPMTEIQITSQRERVTVYENAPRSRDEGVVSCEASGSDQPIIPNSKELREKFKNPEAFKQEIKRYPLVLAGEGGVYENEPIRLDGVVRCEDEVGDAFLPMPGDENNAHWAKQARQKFLEETQRSHHDDPNRQNMAFDESSTQQVTKNISDAKKKIFEIEQASKLPDNLKNPPKIVNIWNEIRPDQGGVYENSPAQRPSNVISSYDDAEDMLMAQMQAEELQRQQQQQQQQQLLNAEQQN